VLHVISNPYGSKGSHSWVLEVVTDDGRLVRYSGFRNLKAVVDYYSTLDYKEGTTYRCH